VGGSTCVQGGFQFRAEGVGNSTTLARIVQLVEDAQANRPQIQRFVDVFASRFVPTVLVFAVLTFFTWIGIGLSRNQKDAGTYVVFAVTRTVGVLSIACPCALGLATPTAIMVATGVAARRGCLVKNAAVWENTRQIGNAVLDKTGTLTKGKPAVREVGIIAGAGMLKPPMLAAQIPRSDLVPVSWISAAQSIENRQETIAHIKTVLAAVEENSEHPLAQALVAWCTSQAGPESVGDVECFENVPGKGVICTLKSVGQIRIGSIEFLGIPLEGALGLWVEGWQRQACVVVALEINGVHSAVFALQDELQEDAAAVLRNLRNRNMSVWMCTGDQKTTALAVGSLLAIPPQNIRAQCLPTDKVKFVEELSQGSKVLMVGDGINDAAALAGADLSIAIGTGSHVTSDSADVVLTHSAISAIPALLDLGTLTMRTIYRNFVWGAGFNIIGLPLAAGIGAPWGVELPPIACGVAMASSSVIVICSSLTITCFRPKTLAE